MKMKKCAACNSYTFKENCPECGLDSKNPNPPKYSPEDKFGDLRRKFKEASENNLNKPVK